MQQDSHPAQITHLQYSKNVPPLPYRPRAQATTEEVNRRLCEVLVELAEDVTMAEAEAKAATAPSQDAGEQQGGPGTGAAEGNGNSNGAAAAAEGEEEAGGAGGPAASGGLDEVAALQAYNDALAAIMEETGMASKVGTVRRGRVLRWDRGRGGLEGGGQVASA